MWSSEQTHKMYVFPTLHVHASIPSNFMLLMPYFHYQDLWGDPTNPDMRP